MKIKINNSIISQKHPTYFIADIAANHDGDLKRAKMLIDLAQKAGADAVKFQHFNAKTIVSDLGFKKLKSKISHQAKWKKSVYDVYKDASIDLNWTKEIYNYCKKKILIFLQVLTVLNLLIMLILIFQLIKLDLGTSLGMKL